MENNHTPESMREIEIFGIPALFTDKQIAHDAIYPGMFRYELEATSDFPNSPRHLTDTATAPFLGTVLTPVPIPMPNGQREIEPGDLFLDTGAGSYTPEEFEEKYLSPNYDAERYGKPD